MPTTTPSRFTPGSRLGDYRIERELRSEVTGTVYLGKHLVLPRPAAIKVMHAYPGELTGMAVQMLREACVLESLAHPGVPRVFECGVLGDKRPWFACEHIVGPTVTQRLVDGPFLATELVSFLRDISEILARLHAMGVVHGRVREGAIVQGPSGRYHLLDWSDTTTLDSELCDIAPEDDIAALGRVALHTLAGGLTDADREGTAPLELLVIIDEMLGAANQRPTGAELYDRLQTIEVPSLIRERRWTPTCGSAPLDATGFTMPSTRTRS